MKSIGYLTLVGFISLLVVACSSNPKQKEKSVKDFPRSISSQTKKTVDGDLLSSSSSSSSSSRSTTRKEVDVRTIKGVLIKTDKTGNEKPISSEEIVLQNDQYEEVARAKTDVDGSFQFVLDIPRGDYSLIYDEGTYHRVFNLIDLEHDFGNLNINPRFD